VGCGCEGCLLPASFGLQECIAQNGEGLRPCHAFHAGEQQTIRLVYLRQPHGGRQHQKTEMVGCCDSLGEAVVHCLESGEVRALRLHRLRNERLDQGEIRLRQAVAGHGRNLDGGRREALENGKAGSAPEEAGQTDAQDRRQTGAALFLARLHRLYGDAIAAGDLMGRGRHVTELAYQELWEPAA